MPEIARAISIGSVLLLVATAVAVLRMATTDADALVRARFVLFSAYVDSAEFDAPPDALRRGRFLTDGVAAERSFRTAVEEIPGWRARLAALRAEPDPLRRAEQLTLDFATYGQIGECGAVVRLIDKIRRPGCCSDHAEVLIALSPLVDLVAREVHLDGHTVAELWLPAERRWVMIDPMFGYVVRDDAGRALSLSEVRQAELARAPDAHAGSTHAVTLDAFRTVALSPDRAQFLAATFGSARPFERITYTNGIDVLREDALRGALLPAPKVVARLIGSVIGVTPTYRTLVDDANRPQIARLKTTRDLSWASVALEAIGAFAWPTRALRDAARRRRGRRATERELVVARAGGARLVRVSSVR